MHAYDYAEPGAYFVTVCAQGHEILFAGIQDGQVRPNECGRIVEQSWLDLPARFPAVELDVFVVMPNHVHGVLFILPEGAGAQQAGSQQAGAPLAAPTLGDIMRVFKSKSAIAVNRTLRRKERRVWQRSYYDRIIRDEAELIRVQQYIIDNPLRWELDRENPEAAAATEDDLW